MAFPPILSIRPTVHAIVGLVILIALTCVLTSSLISSGERASRARGQLAAYVADCGGVSPTATGSPSGPCYYADPSVTFAMPNMGQDDTTLAADVSLTGLASTRSFLVGSFASAQMPLSGNYPVQVWRGHTTRVKIGSRWYLTRANPLASASILPAAALALASLAALSAAVWLLACLWRGFVAQRDELADAPSGQSVPEAGGFKLRPAESESAQTTETPQRETIRL